MAGLGHRAASQGLESRATIDLRRRWRGWLDGVDEQAAERDGKPAGRFGF